MAKIRKDSKGRLLAQGEAVRKDGRYQYAYTDKVGRRHWVYAATLTELRRREQELIRDQLDGISEYTEGRASLNFVFDRYIAGKYDLRSSTRANYIYMYDHFIRESIGRLPVTSIRYSDVKQFYLSLLKNNEVQISTIENLNTILHPTFNLAVRDEVIRSNPASGVLGEIRKKSGLRRGTRSALTLEQQRAFLNFIRTEPEFNSWLALFTLLLGTGARIGEAIGLRWEDVDLESRTISINHSIVYYPILIDGERHSVLSVSKPKTAAGVRSIPMTDEVYEALLDAKKQLRGGVATASVDGMSGFIFVNSSGNVYHPQAVNRVIKRIIETHNMKEQVAAARQGRQPLVLPLFTCHHLRHTFCTRLCENESNLKVIQDIMGHAGIETTMNIYAEATADKKKETMNNLSKNYKLF